MSNLARINLLVGRNNSGKTSILEALNLLAAGSDLNALWRILSRRGEQPFIEQVPGKPIQQEIDLSHAFYGHELHQSSAFLIKTENQRPSRTIRYQIENASQSDNQILFSQLASEDLNGRILALNIIGSGGLHFSVPIIRGSVLRNDVIQMSNNFGRNQKNDGLPVQYITSESLAIQDLINLWNSIVLTPEEDRVVEALKTLEPGIERIASIGGPVFFVGTQQRAGFALKIKGSDKRIPIGSFGDGAWRIVALAAAISRSKDGLLLVDEIDTGLHYSVMEAMWRLIDKSSKDYNVQVFATTHSYDCVHSLAKICNPDDNAEKAVTIQRIEARRGHAVPYDEREVRLAAEQQIEVR